MSDRIARVVDSPFGAPVVVLTVFVAALLTARIAHFFIHRFIRRLARRSLVVPLGQGGLWRTRERRGDTDGSVDVEQRRRQRIDAASRMVSHIASVVIWIVATIVTFHVLEIEAAFFLSSAGFLGAAIAIGGQHKVNDYLTGLSVHFEDRYGVGDEIQVEVGWGEPVTAVVDHVGLFSTRLRDARGARSTSPTARSPTCATCRRRPRCRPFACRCPTTPVPTRPSRCCAVSPAPMGSPT